MKQTKGAIGNLLNRYRAVLKKCHLLNTFGSLAVAGMLVMGGASYANALDIDGDYIVDSTLSTATTDPQGYEDLNVTGNISAFDGDAYYDIDAGNITAGGTIKGGDIVIQGNLTADHVEAYKNLDPTLKHTGNNPSPGTLEVRGAINLNPNSLSTTQRRFDIEGAVDSSVIGNVSTGACISIRGNDEAASFLTGGELHIGGQSGGGSFTVANGMHATIKEVIFYTDTRKARIHGGNQYAPTILDLDAFVMHNGNILAESNWTGAQYAMGVIRSLSPDDGHQGILNGDGNIAVGANTMLGLGEGATLDWLYNQVKTYTGHNTPTQDGVKSVLALNQPLELQNGVMTTDNKNQPVYKQFHIFIDGDRYTENLSFPASTGSDVESSLIDGMEASGTFTQGANTLLIVNGANEQVHYDTATGSASDVKGAISYVTEITDERAGDLVGNITPGTAQIEAGAKLAITGAQTGETYVILGEGFDTDNINFAADASGNATGWQGENLLTDNPLVSLNRNDDGTVSTGAISASQVLPGIEGELAATIDAANVDHLIGTGDQFFNGGQKGTQFLSRALRLAADAPFGYGAAADATTTIESAARIAFAGAVPQMTKMASDAATNAVVNRLGFANPDNGAKSMNVDGKLVDDKALGLALWIAPLWSNQTGFGMEAGNLDYGYNANLGGVSIGADYTWANNIRAGLMFNIGGGYAQSNGGDLNDTTNSMTFWGVGAYGGWEYNNFAVMADVSYTSTWNSVEQDVDSRMGMSDLEADIQASAISAGLRFEYKLETQYLDLIPHVGARYMSINTWGYDVETNGGTVLEGDGFQQNIWTFPVGITFSKELEMNNSWYFKPSLDFTVIPAAGDIKAKEDVRFTGLPYSTEMETQMMDYFTWQGGVGIEFGNENMSVGVNYTLQAGQNSTGHGVFGMFRYEF